MPAGRYDLLVEQGATYTRIFTWKDSAKVVISNVGYTAAMQIRDTVDSTTVIATSAGVSPTIEITLGGLTGTIQIRITAAVTAAFTFDTAVYDLTMTAPITGIVTRLLEGEVKLNKGVTR
jgi:hypothetical protein